METTRPTSMATLVLALVFFVALPVAYGGSRAGASGVAQEYSETRLVSLRVEGMT